MKKFLLGLTVLLMVSAMCSAQSVEERREMVFEPNRLAKWVGASFFTRDAIERDLEVTPTTYVNGMVYYDLPKCPIGVKFHPTANVCLEISFRLFANDALDYRDSILKAGFKFIKEIKTTNVTTDFGIENGTIQVFKLPLPPNGYAVCEILNATYTGFTFYRTQK